MKNSKNILHVVNIYFVLPFFIGDQFIYFKEKGYNLHVACSPSENLKNFAKDKCFKYLETPINRSISLYEDILSIGRICKYSRRNKIGIIVGHTPKGGLIAMIAGLICGIPKRIYFRHGLVYETSIGFKRFILKTVDRIASLCATKIVCVSQSVLQKSINDKLAPTKKQVLLGKGTCNGVDTINQYNPILIDKAQTHELRLKYGISQNEFVIGYSGRLVKDKGIIELISSLDYLRQPTNFKLLLVGPFEERDSLPDDIKNKIQSNPRIIHTGYINGGMEYYYSMMDLYALPSYREGFPTGVLEAQAMNLPVITTKATGCCDSIIDGITGLFITHDPKDIATKIDSIRLNKSIDGNRGRKWVMENFDSRIIWKEIEKLYL